MGATMVLKDGYPCLEPLVNLPEPTRKLLTAYETVSETNDHDGVQRACERVCMAEKHTTVSVSSNKLSFEAIIFLLQLEGMSIGCQNTFMVILKIFLINFLVFSLYPCSYSH